MMVDAVSLVSNSGIEIGRLFGSYPIAIQRQLAQLFDVVLSTIPKNKIYSIIMLGSTPRGELSFKIQGGDVDIFSDYEFVIVYKTPFSPAELESLDKRLSELVGGWAVRSPLFHVDYGVASKAKFRITPPTFWTFEVKKTAALIYGQDARKLLPAVTISNLDKGVLNELILVRLWNMLLCINEGFIRRDETDYERFTVNISYARNALDILSILLPHEGVLLASYESRAAYFAEHDHADDWGQYKSRFAAANRFKLNNYDEAFAKGEFQSLFLDGFTKLLFALSGEPNPDPLNIRRIDFDKIFSEKMVRKLRRKYMDFRLFATYYNMSIGKLSTLWKDSLRPKLVATLLYMHYSLDIRLDGEKQIDFLKAAFYQFGTISNEKSINWSDDESFVDNWNRLRRKILDMMVVWFYGRSRESVVRLERLMDWRDR